MHSLSLAAMLSNIIRENTFTVGDLLFGYNFLSWPLPSATSRALIFSNNPLASLFFPEMSFSKFRDSEIASTSAKQTRRVLRKKALDINNNQQFHGESVSDFNFGDKEIFSNHDQKIKILEAQLAFLKAKETLQKLEEGTSNRSDKVLIPSSPNLPFKDLESAAYDPSSGFSIKLSKRATKELRKSSPSAVKFSEDTSRSEDNSKSNLPDSSDEVVGRPRRDAPDGKVRKALSSSASASSGIVTGTKTRRESYPNRQTCGSNSEGERRGSPSKKTEGPISGKFSSHKSSEHIAISSVQNCWTGVKVQDVKISAAKEALDFMEELANGVGFELKEPMTYFLSSDPDTMPGHKNLIFPIQGLSKTVTSKVGSFKSTTMGNKTERIPLRFKFLFLDTVNLLNEAPGLVSLLHSDHSVASSPSVSSVSTTPTSSPTQIKGHAQSGSVKRRKLNATSSTSKTLPSSSVSENWAGIKIIDLSAIGRSAILKLMEEISGVYNLELKEGLDYQKIIKPNSEDHFTLFFPIREVSKAVIRRLQTYSSPSLQVQIKIVLLDRKELSVEAKGYRAWEARERERLAAVSSDTSLSTTSTGSSYLKVVQGVSGTPKLSHQTLNKPKRKTRPSTPSMSSSDPLVSAKSTKKPRINERTITGIKIQGIKDNALTPDRLNDVILSVVHEVAERVGAHRRNPIAPWSYCKILAQNPPSLTIIFPIMGALVKELNSISIYQAKHEVETTDKNGLLEVSLLDDKQMYDSNSDFQSWDEYLVFIRRVVAVEGISTATTTTEPQSHNTSADSDTRDGAQRVVTSESMIATSTTSPSLFQDTTVVNTTTVVNDSSKLSTDYQDRRNSSTCTSSIQPTAGKETVTATKSMVTTTPISLTASTVEAFNPTSAVQTSSRSSTGVPSIQPVGDKGIGAVTNSTEITPATLFDNVNLACTAMLQPVLDVLHYEIIDREKASVQRIHDHQSVLSIERRLLHIESDRKLDQAIHSRQLESRSKFHMRRLRATINVGFNAGRNHKWLKSFLKFHVPTMRLLSDYSVTKPGLPETILTMYKKSFREFDLNLSSIIGDTKTILPSHPRKVKLRKAAMATRYISTNVTDSDDNYEDIDSDTEAPTLADAVNNQPEVIDLQLLSDDDEATDNDDGSHISASRSLSRLVTKVIGSEGKDGVEAEQEQGEAYSEAVASNRHLVSTEVSETSEGASNVVVDGVSNQIAADTEATVNGTRPTENSSHESASRSIQTTDSVTLRTNESWKIMCSRQDATGKSTIITGTLEADQVPSNLTRSEMCKLVLNTLKQEDQLPILDDGVPDFSILILSQSANPLEGFGDFSSVEQNKTLSIESSENICLLLSDLPTELESSQEEAKSTLQTLGASQETLDQLERLVYLPTPVAQTIKDSSVSTRERVISSGVKRWGLKVVDSIGFIQDLQTGKWIRGLGKGLQNGGQHLIPENTNFISFFGGNFIDRKDYDSLSPDRKGYGMEPPGKSSEFIYDMYSARQNGEEASAANCPTGVFLCHTGKWAKPNARLSYHNGTYSLISTRKIYPEEEIWYAYGGSFKLVRWHDDSAAVQSYSQLILSGVSKDQTRLWSCIENLNVESKGYKLKIAPDIDAAALIMINELLDLSMDGSSINKIIDILRVNGIFLLSRTNDKFEEEWNTAQGFCGGSVLYSAHQRHHALSEFKCIATSMPQTRTKQRNAVIAFLDREVGKSATSGLDPLIVNGFKSLLTADTSIRGQGVPFSKYLSDWIITAFQPEVVKHLWAYEETNPGNSYLHATSQGDNSLRFHSAETIKGYFAGGTDILYRHNHYVITSRINDIHLLDDLLKTMATGVYMVMTGRKPCLDKGRLPGSDRPP